MSSSLEAAKDKIEIPEGDSFIDHVCLPVLQPMGNNGILHPYAIMGSLVSQNVSIRLFDAVEDASLASSPQMVQKYAVGGRIKKCSLSFTRLVHYPGILLPQMPALQDGAPSAVISGYKASAESLCSTLGTDLAVATHSGLPCQFAQSSRSVIHTEARGNIQHVPPKRSRDRYDLSCLACPAVCGMPLQWILVSASLFSCQ